MTESFSIQTDVFSGPLELLIELVEKRKLLINDISLAEVTDEYMRYVSDMQERSLPHTAQFVQLAATLLLIKSKSLLPVLELTQEEEASIEDLEDRLKLYAIFREAAQEVEGQFGQHIMHERTYVPPVQPLFHPDEQCSTDNLANALLSILTELPKTESKPKVQVKPTVSLEQMIDRLHQRIKKQMRLRFSELVAEEPERRNHIVGFLAILESVKQGSVLVAQQRHFADIDIEHAAFKTPSYH